MRQSFFFFFFVLAIFFAGLGSARANDEGILIGDDAVMLGGAVTATTDDGAALWYNPAGLAHATRGSIDVNGSAFSLRVLDAPGTLTTREGDAVSGGWFDLITIPSAVSTLRKVNDQINVALGLFVPEQVGFGERLTLRARDGSAWQLTNDESSQTLYAGGGVAWKLEPTLRIGAGLFGTYRQTSTSTQIFGSYGDPSRPFLTSASFREQLQTLGLEIGAGIQWEPVRGLHIGASFRSFGLQLFTRFRRVGGMASAEDGRVMFEPADLGDLHPSVQLVSPAKLQLGVAYQLDGGALFSLDGTIAHGLENPAVGVSRDVLWNLRAGARFRIDPNILMGVGVFTDRAAGQPPSGFGENRINNYGISWGISIDNPHQLGRSERAETLVFVTFFGIRYALGVGQHGGFFLDPTAPRDRVVLGTNVQSISHDLSLYLGSSLYF